MGHARATRAGGARARRAPSVQFPSRLRDTHIVLETFVRRGRGGKGLPQGLPMGHARATRAGGARVARQVGSFPRACVTHCQPAPGGLSVGSLGAVSRPLAECQLAPGGLSVDPWQGVSWPLADCQLVLGGLSVGPWRVVSQPVAGCQSASGGLSADSWRIVSRPLAGCQSAAWGLSAGPWQSVSWPLADCQLVPGGLSVGPWRVVSQPVPSKASHSLHELQDFTRPHPGCLISVKCQPHFVHPDRNLNICL